MILAVGDENMYRRTELFINRVTDQDEPEYEY